MKRLTAMLLALACLCGCAPALPARHLLNEGVSERGAAAFAGEGDHAGSRYYVVNDFYNMKSGGGLHLLPAFAAYQQTEEYSCACACALMVLRYFGQTAYDEAELCRLAGTDTEAGTTPAQLAALFEELGWQVDCHTGPDAAFAGPEDWRAYLVEQIDGGTPVLVDWVDWGGHWQVVIGVDDCGTESVWDDVLIFADPYDVTDHCQDGYYTFPLGRFFSMWKEGSGDGVQPYVTARP